MSGEATNEIYIFFNYRFVSDLVRNPDDRFCQIADHIMYDGDIHYANTPMQYTTIFHGCKNFDFQMKSFNIFLTFAQNIDCGYTLAAVLTSIHNLCFGAK